MKIVRIDHRESQTGYKRHEQVFTAMVEDRVPPIATPSV